MNPLVYGPEVARPLITPAHVLALSDDPKLGSVMTLREAMECTRNVSRPYRNHLTEAYPCPNLTITPLYENSRIGSSQNSATTGRSFRFPTVLSGAINAKTASPSEQPSTKPASTPKPGLATTLPLKNSRSTSAYPTQLSSTTSPAPHGTQMQSVLDRLDIPEAWWRAVANDKQVTSVAMRKTVMVSLRKDGMTFSQIARLIQMKHSTVMWSLKETIREERAARNPSTQVPADESASPAEPEPQRQLAPA